MLVLNIVLIRWASFYYALRNLFWIFAWEAGILPAAKLLLVVLILGNVLFIEIRFHIFVPMRNKQWIMNYVIWYIGSFYLYSHTHILRIKFVGLYTPKTQSVLRPISIIIVLLVAEHNLPVYGKIVREHMYTLYFHHYTLTNGDGDKEIFVDTAMIDLHNHNIIFCSKPHYRVLSQLSLQKYNRHKNIQFIACPFVKVSVLD